MKRLNKSLFFLISFAWVTALMIWLSSCDSYGQISKYKPGFVFWMDGARTKVTLIEQFRPIDELGFKEFINESLTGNKWLDSINTKHTTEFLSRLIWRVKLEYDNVGYPDVTELGQLPEQTIDLETGKAFQWRGGGKTIYYDSIESCILKN